MGLTLQRFPDGIGSFTPRVDSHLLYKRKGGCGCSPRHRGAVRPLRPRCAIFAKLRSVTLATLADSAIGGELVEPRSETTDKLVTISGKYAGTPHARHDALAFRGRSPSVTKRSTHRLVLIVLIHTEVFVKALPV